MMSSFLPFQSDTVAENAPMWSVKYIRSTEEHLKTLVVFGTITISNNIWEAGRQLCSVPAVTGENDEENGKNTTSND